MIAEILLALAVVAAAGDLYTTRKFLKLGFTEANPLAAFLLRKFGFASLIALKSVSFLLPTYIVAAYRDSVSAIGIAGFMLAINAYAVYHNKKVLDKA